MKKTRSTSQNLTRDDIRIIQEICSIGAVQAGKALSKLTGLEINVQTPELLTLSTGEVPSLFGGMNKPARGVMVPFRGDEEGKILLLFSDEGAAELESLLLKGSRPTSEALVDSAFLEMGNILSGAILTVLSRLAERVLINSPPLIVRDMAGAILDTILAELGTRSDDVIALVSRLSDSSGGGLVETVILPDPRGLSLFFEAAARLRSG